MTGSERRGPVVLLAGALGLVLILAAGIFGGWEYINLVPPYVPHLPPGPSPNGYLAAERAAATLQKLTPATPTAVPGSGRPPQAVPRSRWPEEPPAAVRARLVRIRPLLNQVRAQFRYAWSAAPDLPNRSSRWAWTLWTSRTGSSVPKPTSPSWESPSPCAGITCNTAAIRTACGRFRSSGCLRSRGISGTS